MLAELSFRHRRPAVVASRGLLEELRLVQVGRGVPSDEVEDGSQHPLEPVGECLCGTVSERRDHEHEAQEPEDHVGRESALIVLPVAPNAPDAAEQQDDHGDPGPLAGAHDRLVAPLADASTDCRVDDEAAQAEHHDRDHDVVVDLHLGVEQDRPHGDEDEQPLEGGEHLELIAPPGCSNRFHRDHPEGVYEQHCNQPLPLGVDNGSVLVLYNHE